MDVTIFFRPDHGDDNLLLIEWVDQDWRVSAVSINPDA